MLEIRGFGEKVGYFGNLDCGYFNGIKDLM